MIAAEMSDLCLAMATPDDERKRVEQSYLRYIGSGVEYFATLVLLALAGMWLDDRLGTSPLLTIVLTILGFAAATWNLIRSVLRPPRKPGDRP